MYCQITFVRIYQLAVISLLALLAFTVHSFAQVYSTPAKQALLLDADTGTVLYSKEPDTKIPPASLAKLMTMEVVFEQLKRGRLKLDDKFFISEDAWRRGGANSGGSAMFAELNSEIELESLIRGVIVQSGNDASIAIAEGLAGSEAAFAGLMNQRARAIGLTGSHFTNSTGLPDEKQYVTLRDLAKLARHIIAEYPQYYRYYSEESFTWNKITQRNRNPLLKMKIGADGFKTGFTEASGYAIVGTANKNGQRLIAILSGMTSKKMRREETRKILDWGSRAFERIQLFDAKQVVGQAGIYGGAKSGVDVMGIDPIKIYLPIGFSDKLKARISYQSPLLPPVEKGDQVATLKVWIDNELSQETPLYAAEDVGKGAIHDQAWDAFTELLLGWL